MLKNKKNFILISALIVFLLILLKFISSGKCNDAKSYFGLYFNEQQRIICHLEQTTGFSLQNEFIISSDLYVDQGFGDFQNNIIIKLSSGSVASILESNKKIFGRQINFMTQEDIENSFEISFYESAFSDEIVFSEDLYFSRIGDLNGKEIYNYGFLNLPGFNYGIIIFDLENDIIFYAIGA